MSTQPQEPSRGRSSESFWAHGWQRARTTGAARQRCDRVRHAWPLRRVEESFRCIKQDKQQWSESGH